MKNKKGGIDTPMEVLVVSVVILVIVAAVLYVTLPAISKTEGLYEFIETDACPEGSIKGYSFNQEVMSACPDKLKANNARHAVNFLKINEWATLTQLDNDKSCEKEPRTDLTKKYCDLIGCLDDFRLEDDTLEASKKLILATYDEPPTNVENLVERIASDKEPIYYIYKCLDRETGEFIKK